jgi:hypothetical protein
MSKAAREFFERGDDIQANVVRHAMGDMGRPAPTEIEPSALEGAKILGGQIWDALTPAFSLGAEEISRALFTGNTYVYHGDTIPEQEPLHGLPAKEMENGREM